MRGHGGVNTRFAFETLVDRMARANRLDPFAVRRANLLHSADADDERVDGSELRPRRMSRRGREASGWKGTVRTHAAGARGWAWPVRITSAGRQAHPLHRRTACGHPSKLDHDGGVTALTYAPISARVSSTMVAIAVAETLGVGLDLVRVVSAIQP